MHSAPGLYQRSRCSELNSEENSIDFCFPVSQPSAAMKPLLPLTTIFFCVLLALNIDAKLSMRSRSFPLTPTLTLRPGAIVTVRAASATGTTRFYPRCSCPMMVG